jgi:hypothetical protein
MKLVYPVCPLFLLFISFFYSSFYILFLFSSFIIFFYFIISNMPSMIPITSM